MFNGSRGLVLSCASRNLGPECVAHIEEDLPQAMQAGGQRYTDIHVPALAIVAVPQDLGSGRAAAEAYSAQEDALREARAKAFESGVANVRVVRLPHANHFVFLSNEADVLREVRAFLASLH